MDIVKSIESIISTPNFSGSELLSHLENFDLAAYVQNDSSILQTNGKNILYLFRKVSKDRSKYYLPSKH